MAQTKQSVLDNIRRYTSVREPKPDVSAFRGIEYLDKVEQFKSIFAAVGGEVIDLAEGQDLGELIRQLYPEARRIISDLDLGDLPHQTLLEAGDALSMNGTDLCVLTTPLGVCENGYCWVEQQAEWRAQLFIAENLLFILDRDSLVHNMHEAARVISSWDMAASPFGGFIAGPSKTADIEQSLVMGAHGARGVKVLLR